MLYALLFTDTVILDASGNGTLPANIGDGSSVDNCPPLIETSPAIAVTCDSIGTRSVILTATDGSGNVGTFKCSYVVVDTTSPVASCKDVSIYLDENGVDTISPIENCYAY